jgi:cell division protein FtsB
MSLIQLPKVIELVNSLSFKVNELEQEVKKLKQEIAKQAPKPATKKND